MQIISTNKAPLAVGPYSQAVISGDFIFCSGQIGIDPGTGELLVGVVNQAEQILKNIEAVLFEAGSDFNKVVKATIFLTNVNDFAEVNQLYTKYFGEHKPARSTVVVASLPKGALLEIEVLANK